MKSSRLKELIRRYQSGKASPAERYIVDRWLESFQQDDGNGAGVEETGYLTSFQQTVLDRAFATGKPSVKHRPHWARWAAAALLLSVVSMSLWFYTQQSGAGGAQVPEGITQTVSTGIRQVKRLMLPDSTIVFLNANTSLEVAADFGTHERVVKLVGEAYFEVQRDTLKPFKVQTDGLEVKVLGTLFNVNAYQTLDDIQVAVNAGKVQVSDQNQVLALLHAEEGLTYNRQTASFQRSQLSSTKASSWREGVSVLAEASFAMLAQVLHNYYGIELLSTDNKVRSTAYNFTVRSTRTLEQTMVQLCEMLTKKYRKEGNRIIIY
ncbi:FecR family protein [Parapedobacter koreensis]|uniref:FecR family protein n=1 Tax=Parapedobacter koreensis TaxID=332977 RepID=A0A1H7FLV1_9SPHI|nr:FecR family protein [Parapedobacter koreensis]SEK27073.1 FecR family protein [Parapedobacter koreensis]